MARARIGASSLAFIAVAAPAYANTEAADPAVAQSTVSGFVYDDTGSALPGARISVRGVTGEASTNLQGAFSLVVPDIGDVEITVDYLSRPRVTRVIRAADRGRSITIVVANDVDSAGDIVVTGALVDTTARALNQQRQADNTVTILSADAIGRFPDPNIAEALQRVPGIGIERDQGEGRDGHPAAYEHDGWAAPFAPLDVAAPYLACRLLLRLLADAARHHYDDVCLFLRALPPVLMQHRGAQPVPVV